MRAFLGKQIPDRYDLQMAAGDQEALRDLRQAEPDLMVIDAALAPRGGRVLCEKAKHADASVPVLLLDEPPPRPASQAPAPTDRAGPDAVLEKPFATNALCRQMDRLLYGSGMGDACSVDRSNIDEIAENALQVIEERLSDPDLTAAEVAEAVGVSRRHLTRLLKGAVGQTPAALLRTRRIKRAKRKLWGNPDTIANVARSVGFRSASHFSQVFRKQVGCTPTAYVEEHASASQ